MSLVSQCKFLNISSFASVNSLGDHGFPCRTPLLIGMDSVKKKLLSSVYFLCLSHNTLYAILKTDVALQLLTLSLIPVLSGVYLLYCLSSIYKCSSWRIDPGTINSRRFGSELQLEDYTRQVMSDC